MNNTRLFLFTLLVLAVACQPAPAATALPATVTPTRISATGTPPPAFSSEFTLSSPAMSVGGDIPLLNAQVPFKVALKNSLVVCPGAPAGKQNVSPALAWSNVPPKTQSLVLTMVDDMHFAHPNLPEGTLYTHWIVFSISPTSSALPEGAANQANALDGALQGANSYPPPYDQGYGGPCPPVGETHLYIFTLYALDATLDLEAGAAYADVTAAMQGHILAQAELRMYYTGQ